MKIRDFRCIEDTEEFSLNQVTCLVGKNESGKTAVLKALHKLKSDEDSIESFIPAHDFPKRRWRPNVEIPSSHIVIETLWEFDDSEFSEFQSLFGIETIIQRTFRVSKGYENKRYYDIKIDEQALVKKLISDNKLSATEKKHITDTTTIIDLKKELESIAQRTPNQEGLFQIICKNFPNGPTQAVINRIDDLLPTFLYFDQYLRLPGIVAVNELLKRKNQNQLSDSDRVFLALLSLAGTSIEAIHGAKTFEEFNSSLRAVSNQISDQIFSYWSQNRHLDVQMRLDEARPEDQPPFNSGFIFRTRIFNQRHRADTSFDERSSGFVWFFSFLVWFNQLRETYGKKLIILLDEPGLSLHARAQHDLLRYMNEQLKPNYQLIYTTHSPFMIDPDNLLSARTVEDVVKVDKKNGEELLLGTKINEHVLSSDPDTISPLQKALDFEITQTLFVGRHTLLVEGPSDLLYLQWFSQKLKEFGKSGLDYRWCISKVGGIDRIPGFVSLFRGNNLHIAALMDVQKGHKQKIENARNALEENHLLLTSDFAEQEEADLEDVFGREFYVDLVNKAYDLPSNYLIPNNKHSDSSIRVTLEVQDHFRTLPQSIFEYTHLIPAEKLFQGELDGTKLSGFEFALARMEKVIDKCNSLIKTKN